MSDFESKQKDCQVCCYPKMWVDWGRWPCFGKIACTFHREGRWKMEKLRSKLAAVAVGALTGIQVQVGWWLSISKENFLRWRYLLTGWGRWRVNGYQPRRAIDSSKSSKNGEITLEKRSRSPGINCSTVVKLECESICNAQWGWKLGVLAWEMGHKLWWSFNCEFYLVGIETLEAGSYV